MPTASASGIVPAALPTVDPVKSREDIVSLSRQAIQARGNDLAVSTGESAQNFVGKIAKTMFGDSAETATVAYNLGSLKSAVGAPGASDENVRDVSLNLKEDASFIGTGQINTQDGRSFDFEVVVKYKANTGEQTLAAKQRIEMPDVLVLTGKPLPAIEFPGSLNDLFKLLGRQLASDRGAAGDLTLRLTRLVDRAALLAPRQNDTALARASASNASKNAYVNAYASAAQLTDPADDTPS